MSAAAREAHEVRTARFARPAGPAIVILAHDRRHALHASWAVLEAGTLTAQTRFGLRSWPMREVVCVRWGPEAVAA